MKLNVIVSKEILLLGPLPRGGPVAYCIFSIQLWGSNNNNNNNNHFTRTLSVLTSARVFMRRQPIPPLCGGAVQALPNIQTTLRDHPHPASRPMTLGHFTSWRADDRGYYSRHMHLLYIIHVVYETYDTHERDTTVGHIFGARAGGFSDFLYEKVVRFHMFY